MRLLTLGHIINKCIFFLDKDEIIQLRRKDQQPTLTHAVAHNPKTHATKSMKSHSPSRPITLNPHHYLHRSDY